MPTIPSPNVATGRRTGVALDVEDVPQFVAEALSLRTGEEAVGLHEARGRTLVSDLAAPMALPPFDHAAVDGYALREGNLGRLGVPIPARGRLRAGDQSVEAWQGAIRVLTGAPIPPDGSAVVMQEHVNEAHGAIRLSDRIRIGANIRRRGEDVAPGDLVMRRGTVLDARHIALLAALAMNTVRVRARVSVAIIATGKELSAPGAARAPSQINDSNTAMATAFFAGHGCNVVRCERVGDDEEALSGVLKRLVGTADLIVTSGGMANGDEDHARRCVEAVGGAWRTVGVKMKPGKPAAFGTAGGTTILGLPGNPFAALVALIVFGRPILAALDGRRSASLSIHAEAAFDLHRRPGRAEFFPARRIV